MCELTQKATVEEQVILAFGTSSSDESQWRAVTYDPDSGEGTTVAQLDCREGAVVVNVGNGEVIIAGGWKDYQVPAATELFDCKLRSTRQLAALNFDRSQHGACQIDDTVFVCGGAKEEETFRSCELYLRSENKWILLPDMIKCRTGLAVVALPDRRVFAIGGATQKGIHDSVEGCQMPLDLFTTVSNAQNYSFWKKYPPMLQPIYGHSAVYFQGYIFVAGGWSESSVVEVFSVSEIDTEGGQWSYLSEEMVDGRDLFSLVLISQQIYAFGNEEMPQNGVERFQIKEKCESVSTAEIFDLMDSTKWEKLPSVSLLSAVSGVVSIPKSLLL